MNGQRTVSKSIKLFPDHWDIDVFAFNSYKSRRQIEADNIQIKNVCWTKELVAKVPNFKGIFITFFVSKNITHQKIFSFHEERKALFLGENRPI